MFLLKKILAALILPPAGPILLALFGLWLCGAKVGAGNTAVRHWRRSRCSAAGLLSLPVVGNALMAPLEPHPPIAPGNCGASRPSSSSAAAPTTPRRNTAATRSALHAGTPALRRPAGRESSLPVLVTGGAPFGGRAEAESMREALERDFGVKVRWVETASRDTAENARLSAPLLKAAGVTRIALVSHGWHLPRAIELFEKQGIEVTPAPTAFSTAGSPSLLEDLPARRTWHQPPGAARISGPTLQPLKESCHERRTPDRPRLDLRPRLQRRL
jgi:hypothetical protein